jgi:hypothetical protein
MIATSGRGIAIAVPTPDALTRRGEAVCFLMIFSGWARLKKRARAKAGSPKPGEQIGEDQLRPFVRCRVAQALVLPRAFSHWIGLLTKG